MAPEMVQRTAYLDKLTLFRDNTKLVKVIVGVRRCGKSTLLDQYAERLRAAGVSAQEILRVNLESAEFDDCTDHRQLNRYLKEHVPRTGRCYVFLDEIQRVKGWEKSVDALMVDTAADIYLTGSNSQLLSSEFATFLAGRYVSIDMLPLSFAEYRELRGGGRPAAEVFAQYAEYGGFPAVDPSRSEAAAATVLDDLISSVVYRDLVLHGRVRQPAELERLITYLMLNIGNPIALGEIAKVLKMNARTVSRYLGLLEKACLFYRADRYNLVSTALSPTPKYYTVDPGLRNHRVGFVSKDRGRVLENIVYLELIRRGYRVIVGQYAAKEVDFVAERPGGGKEYYQVCLGYYDEATEARELAPLRAIRDSFPKTVILYDPTWKRSVTAEGIIEQGAVDWLLEAGAAAGPAVRQP